MASTSEAPLPTQAGRSRSSPARERALDLLRELSCPEGFHASFGSGHNYDRVWARDSVVAGLAALAVDEDDLIETFRQSLEILGRNRGPHGEIPSNVDPQSSEVSLGTSVGRVDADLWWVIGCGQYVRHTDDVDFLRGILPILDEVEFLLGAWEFNARGLLYVPATADWADEYVHAGYVLYDQLLYLQAKKDALWMREHGGSRRDEKERDGIRQLEQSIRTNFWLEPEAPDEKSRLPEGVYHEVLYRRGRRAAGHAAGRHWVPFFAPHGYGYRLDAWANVLANLTGVSDASRAERVERALDEATTDDLALVPAFCPVIRPRDDDWEELQMTFNYEFRNHPGEYHNGGRWPIIGGFHVAALAARGQRREARRRQDAVERAARLEGEDGRPWSFPEFVHGERVEPGGRRGLAWSAAGVLIGQAALSGRSILRAPEWPSGSR